MQGQTVPIMTENQAKFGEIRSFYRTKFTGEPSFIVRVPGRVNLIGEHIDYCGFGVLPMAIDQDCLLAVGINEKGKIHLANMDQVKYCDHEAQIDKLTIKIPPSWYHYVFCGLKGAQDELGTIGLPGMNIAVRGSIPASSGLSSSSALVTASLLAAMYALKGVGQAKLDKIKMANVAAQCERYIGTQGGAMDQSIALLARDGYAKLIEFEPSLKAVDVRLPKDACFFFSHSGLTCNKAATDNYNARVFETKAAALMIADYCHLKPEKFGKQSTCLTLAQIKKLLNKSYDEMIAIVDEALEPDRVYKSSEILEYLDLKSARELTFLMSNGSEQTRERMESVLANYGSAFKIHDRATHVYKEASRVEKVVSLCSDESNLDDETILQAIGKLMNESHQSCSNLYECSCEELDKLVQFARSNGAIGSRMTGAGWGGGIVSLVPEKRSQEFQRIMIGASDFTFKSFPSQGAAVYL